MQFPAGAILQSGSPCASPNVVKKHLEVIPGLSWLKMLLSMYPIHCMYPYSEFSTEKSILDLQSLI